MINNDEIFEKAIEHWRLNKGIGTAIIPKPLDDKLIILGILQRMYSKSSTANVVIITNSFIDRQLIIEFLTLQENSEENNNEFKKLIEYGKLKILTDNYIVSNKPFTPNLLCIWYRPDSICQDLLDYVCKCKFKLVVFDKFPNNYNILLDIYKIAPLLPDFQQAEVEQIRMSRPIEEKRIGIDIPSDSNAFELLNKYNEYITTSLNIFGSFDVIHDANMGNTKLNVSSTQVCYQLAQDNGWEEHLDMSVRFNQEIDELYNPNNLKERASQTYDIIRERNKLISDYDGKLDVILDIVRKNKDKKILIINKRGEFANVVTEFLNNLSETDICGNYHDKVDNVPAITFNGSPIYYKSGSKKGERKLMGAKAQKSLNEKRFNFNYINVLSTNNAPDKELTIDVDIVIITSPMCEDIKTYMYRLSKVNFNSNHISLYSLYCRNTSEQRLIENKDITGNHTVVNVCIGNDEDAFSDFITVD